MDRRNQQNGECKLKKKIILDKIFTLCHTEIFSTNAQLFAQAGEQSANDANRLLNIRQSSVRIPRTIVAL